MYDEIRVLRLKGSNYSLLFIGMHYEAQATCTFIAAFGSYNAALFAFGIGFAGSVMWTVHFVLTQGTIALAITYVLLMNTNPENMVGQ